MKINCLHFDVARGAFLRPPVVKELINLCAQSHYTHLVLYLESMIKLDALKKSSPSCAYTKEDWREFEDEAAENGIELIAHFNVIGHSRDICHAMPELAAGLGEEDFDPAMPELAEWTQNGLNEFCQIARGQYFLIGGDEWQPGNGILSRPDENIARLWCKQINLAVEALSMHGKKAIVWHDMLIHHPEALELLDRRAVVNYWFYDFDSDYPFLQMAKERGFETMMTTWGDPLSFRRAKAGRRAWECAQKYHADGIMTSYWENCFFEKCKFSIPLSAKLIQHGEMPLQSVMTAYAALDVLNRNRDGKLKAIWSEKLRLALLDKVAISDPDFRNYCQNLLTGNLAEQQLLFAKFQYPQGPLFETLTLNKPATSPLPFAANPLPEGIEIVNGDERFRIYHAYGATLQDYRKNGKVIIPAALNPQALTNRPGGYRSYTALYGFRPIWAFGSHSNPCFLWQGPFSCRLKKNGEDELTIILNREVYQVKIEYRIVVKRGISGFDFAVAAVNKIDNADCAINWNLPLSPGKIGDLKLQWGDKTLPCSDFEDTFFSLDTHELTVSTSDYRLQITAEKEKSAGIFIDWSDRFITPDLHGKYFRLNRGDCLKTQWRFRIQ